MKKTIFIIAFLLIAVSTAVYFSCRKKERTLLVVGCARSGTTYISQVLKASGLMIGHERMKQDGTSSCDLAVNPKVGRWKVRMADYHFAHIFHQVRDPLKVISSVYITEDRHSWHYIMQHIPEIHFRDSHLVKCAKYWYYWNLKAEKMSEWTYRLEDLDHISAKWDEFEQRLGKKISRAAIQAVPKDTNTRTQYRRHFTWEDLEKELDPELYRNIRDLAQKYGYPI